MALLVLAAACGGGDDSNALPQGSEPVELDPADLVAGIDNPYWPMAPGSKWVYREESDEGASSGSKSPD